VVLPSDEPVRSPSEEGNVLNRAIQLETRNNYERDPLADQDILESIGPEYFNSEDFDPSSHELKVHMLGSLRGYKYLKGK
jgi:hypothetical protein